MDVKLIIFKPGGGQSQVALKRGRYVVGRQSGVTLQIPLPSVSREHCELIVNDDTLRVRDLGSSNGTFRNNDRITVAMLGAGDYLRVGELSMGIQINGEPAQIARPPETKVGSAESSMAKTPVKPLKALDNADSAETVPTPTDSTENDASDSAEALLESFGVDESSMIDIDIDLDDKNAPKL